MDGDTLLNLLLVVLFVLIGGLFAGTEMAIVTLRESQVKQIERSGRHGPKTAALVRNPNLFLSAVQIGVTVAGFFSSAYGAATLAPDVAPILISWGLPDGTADTVALIAMTLLIAYLSLILGELVPKRLAMQRAEGFTKVLAPPLNVFAKLMRPVIGLLSVSTNAVVRLLGGNPKVATEEVSAEELREMLVDNRSIQYEHRGILAGAFTAGNRLVREVMQPRTDVAFLDSTLNIEQARTVMRDLPHTRYPVLGESIDDIIGFLHIRDVYEQSNTATPVAELARPILPLPGTNKVPQSLALMRAGNHQITLVVDEYGGTAGIATLEDLVEEFVGEIYDEYDPDPAPTGQGPSSQPAVGESIDIDAGLILQEIPSLIGVELPDDGSYETIAGFLIDRFGRVPDTGDSLEYAGHRFEALQATESRVERIRITRLAEDATAEGA
ncbi:hemolysin family protein [Arthrobacter castelli]|uniref:hemolysin family protein n=1 Tax=Arthrobacter castelli TaxID=271431 RepID=UPI000410D3C0|nr:hemolysin family protein [Arthrobacter castelli]